MLEGCQPFRELSKGLFLGYFYLLFKERSCYHLWSWITCNRAFKLWSEVTPLAPSTRRCPEVGEQRPALVTSPQTKVEST